MEQGWVNNYFICQDPFNGECCVNWSYSVLLQHHSYKFLIDMEGFFYKDQYLIAGLPLHHVISTPAR